MAGLNISLDPAKSSREHRRDLADLLFVESPRMEALLKELTANPEMELSSNTRMAVYLYRDQKARAARRQPRVRQFEIADARARIAQIEAGKGKGLGDIGELRGKLARLLAQEGGE